MNVSLVVVVPWWVRRGWAKDRDPFQRRLLGPTGRAQRCIDRIAQRAHLTVPLLLQGGGHVDEWAVVRIRVALRVPFSANRADHHNVLRPRIDNAHSGLLDLQRSQEALSCALLDPGRKSRDGRKRSVVHEHSREIQD